MKKFIFILVTLFGLTIIGCSNGGLSGGKPPKAFIEINKERFETILGTYCWKGTCVDSVGAIELLEGKKPIEVKAGENIAFVMDYDPKPNKFHVLQININNKTEVLLKNNHFSAPTQKGVYYYSYGVWWMDEKEEHLSHGDAFYVFVLEVK